MKKLVHGAETIYALLFGLGLLAPLVFFFVKVAPWRVDAVRLFAEPGVRAAMWNSFTLAATTSVAATSLAFVFSWLLWRYRWPTRLANTVSLALKIPYLLPPFFFAIGWIALAAPEVGYLNKLATALGMPTLPTVYGMGGTIFVFVLWATALAMIQIQIFFAQMPGHLEDAAIMCGASPFKTFLKITVPLAWPRLLACMLLTAVNALAAFGVPAMLASPARTYVFTTRIYQSIKSSQDFSQAGLLSFALLVVTLVLIIAQQILSKTKSGALVGGKASRPSALEPSTGARVLFAAAAFFAVVSCVLPFLAVTVQSLLHDRSDLTSLTFEKYVYVFTALPDSMSAVQNSVTTSALAAGVATLVGLVIAYGAARLRSPASRILTEVWDIGYALPGTIIALCLIVFYSGSLTDTVWILALAYLVKYAAFALRTLTPAMASISRELEEAAWMSGASPARSFLKIVVPMLKPAVAAALLLALVPMLSELTMSVLLAGAGTETLGTLIYRLQEYADPGSAAVLAVLVAAATLALNAALKKMSRGSFGI